MAENHDLVDVALHILQAGTPNDLEVFFITAWSVWYSINQAIHEGQCLLLKGCLEIIMGP